MLIDWFTVFAQALNFLILVWLMQRFLYKPIQRAIDAREKRVAAVLAEADQKKAEAQKERELFQKKNEELERQRADLMDQMNDEVESERFRLLDDVRQAADDLQSKRLEALRRDALELRQNIRRRTQQEVFAIARKTLADLATSGLEERMVDVFMRHLRELGEKEKAELKAAFQAASGPAIVRSAFAIPEAQQAALESVIGEQTGQRKPVCFEIAPLLVSGIEFVANGQKIAWNIEAYLKALETGLDALLDVSGKREPNNADMSEVNGSMTASA